MPPNMPLKPRDPLLTAARFVIGLFTVIFGLTAIAVASALPAVFVFQGHILAELAKQGSSGGMDVIFAIAALVALVAVMLALFVWFLMTLRRIVDSVGEGDPFVPINAARLSRMAWIAVGVQVTMLPMGGLARYIGNLTEGHVEGDTGMSVAGLLIALILFVLARVFRKGTEMREELEGTV